MTRAVEVLSDAVAVADRAAQVIASELRAAVGERGVAHLALSGGRAPVRTYELLAEQSVPWSAVHVWAVDERFVAATDERNNWRMITDALLTRAGVDDANRHPVPVDAPTVEQAATVYEQRIVGALGTPPRFDVCIMGIGPDGHTASLFPGMAALEAPSLVAATPSGFDPFVARVTLTFRALNAARVAIYIVTGEEKADVVAAALAGGDVAQVPARGVQPEEGRLVWILDAGAGRRVAG